LLPLQLFREGKIPFVRPLGGLKVRSVVLHNGNQTG
jgi:hypothetical protein